MKIVLQRPNPYSLAYRKYKNEEMKYFLLYVNGSEFGFEL